jgi:hypothetical protein
MIKRCFPLAALLAAQAAAAAVSCPTTDISPDAALPAGAVGASYNQAIGASGSSALPYAFSITAGLPAGFGLDLIPAAGGAANLTGVPAHAGRHLVTLTATDADGCSGGRTYVLDVARGEQTIQFTSAAPAAAAVGGAPYAVAATASSSLPVSFTIDPAAASVCAIAGSAVSFVGAGTCIVDADQGGDADWNAAPRAQQSFAVGRAAQTIAFTSPPPTDARVAGPGYTVAATATSGLPVAFSIDASAAAVCSIAGDQVSFHGAGTCVIDADQAGDADHEPAPRVQQSFAVAKGEQTLAFTSTAPAAAAVGGTPYAVAAAATSGLAVTFSVDPSAAGVCSVAGATVTFQHVGTCVIDADQPGDANWNAAPRVQQSFAVGIGSQTVAFTTPAPADAAVAGAAYAVAAAATSGLPVTLTIDAAAGGACALAGATVTFQHAGTCVIDADQAGNADYAAAPRVQQSFAVGRGAQAIAFTSPPPADAVVGGAAYEVSATATSGLPVTFSIDPLASGVCAIAGGTVSFHGAGTCVVDADQGGDADWNPAPRAQQSFAVGRGTQTISFTSTAPATANVGGAPYVVAATASSGLPVTFTIDPAASTVCAIAGTSVSFIGAGTCIIDADQPGDANWNAAPRVQQSFAVSACLALAVGEVAYGAMPDGTHLCVGNSDAANAEFLYLPINLGQDLPSTLRLVGSNIVAAAGPPAPVQPAARRRLAAFASPPQATFEPLGMDAPPAFPAGREPGVAGFAVPRAPAAPLAVGQLIDLNASIGCSAAPDVRKGRVEAVTTPQSPGQPLLYAVQEVVETTPGAGDWHPAVPSGFVQGQFQNLIDAFVQSPPGSTPAVGMLSSLKTGAMDLFANYFGAVSDVDGNGGVIVFFTRKMNELSPPGGGLAAPAMFQIRDLSSVASCADSNQGEILYALMPDPTGSVNGNVRTLSYVYGAMGPALVHHFAHLAIASRRIYFSHSAQELTWLDEGIAWAMQEVVFFNASVGLGARSNIDLSMLTTGPNASVRVNDFNTYENPLFGQMRTYLYQLNASNGGKRLGPLRPLPYSTGTVPNLHENVAPNFAGTAAFLRYALDRKNAGDAALIRALVNSQVTGLLNLQTVFGADPNEWMRDFLVGLYADDAVAGAAAQYSLPSWNYRSVYGGLSGFPLATDSLTNDTALDFTLDRGGGARYARFGVAPGRTATLTLTEGGAPPAPAIVTALVRTK